MTLLFLIVGLYVFIQTPFGQNWIARQVTKKLSRDLQTKVSIRHVDFSLFNNMHLQGVLVEDRQGDTLLYAGDIKVRITDWFFFKKEAELKYVGLENAVIKFQRTDSIWRQQFIFDYFASPSTGNTKKKAGIRFDLKKVEMKNVTFIKKDGWLGQDMTVQVGVMNMDADKLSLSGNKYEINSLFVTDPVVAIHNYARRKPKDSLATLNPEENISSPTYWNKGQTVFSVANLKIINGTFKNTKQNNRAPLDYFDGQNILFTQINADLSNSSFIGDTIFSKLKLSAKERSGLELKNLSADLKMSPKGMEFGNMDLVTNRSTLRNYFSMSYDDMKDMGDFIHKVKMAAVFTDSYVDSDDIAFFAPGMRSWKKEIKLEGKVRGTVSELVGRDMIVQAGNSTMLNGDISLSGLPDINQTFIDFKANEFRTTYNDAVTIVPAIRRVTTTPDLRKLQYVNFKGSFTGFIRDFVTFGTIQTNLGTLVTDLNMKLPKGQQAIYSGNIATDNFRLGDFLGNPDIGSVALKGTVKGSGFNDKSLNAIIDADIRYAEYKKYRYENILVKGKFEKKLFEGVASIRDANADLTLNGVIDLNNKPPRFDLVADVVHANLRNLNLTKDSISFAGKLNFNFTSNSIENFLGDARITDAEITRNGKRLPFDSLIVSSRFVDGVKSLVVNSNEFEAKIEGDFDLAGLPDAFRFFLNKYYPSYITAPRKIPSNQDIRFNITTFYADEYLQLIDSNITGFNNSHFEGNLNLARNELNFTADVPQFKFVQYNFNQVKLQATGTEDSLVLVGETRDIRINDSLSIPQALFRINAHNDSSRVSINSGANQTVEKANLNALVLTYSDGVEIEFDPSSFTLNGKLWSIDENGVLRFRKNSPASGQLVLSEGEQKILLQTIASSKGNWNDLKVQLTNINLGDLSPLLLPRNRLEGLLSGNVLVEDPTGNLKITSSDIQTRFLRLDNDSLGEIKATLAYDNKTKELAVVGNTVNQENYLGFDARIFLGDPLKAKNNLIALKARNFQIKILERFLGTLFSDMQGYLTGDINVSGEFQNLNVSGKGRLKDAGLKVNFTQVFYKIQDTDIELKTTKIDLNGIVLTDTATGNPIYITGGIEHESFKNMFYNLDISTRKPRTTDEDNNKPVLLLNTTYKDNKQFYGKVKGTGSLTLAGPQSEMFMTINAVASSADSSNITIPPVSSRESGTADFLVERKFGREMDESDFNRNATNIIYDVEVTATPAVTVKVVLDELTGDEIKGRGEGTLHIRSGTSEPLSLRGRFDIAEGDYQFTFQSFFKKPFVLKPGANNYIEWFGDPNDATINLTAIYTATNVSYAPLFSTLINEGVSRAQGDVYVVANLTDKLFQPSIKLSLDFPQSSPVNNDPALAFSVQQLQKNENEINKQATYLVVLGSFAPVEGGPGTQSSFGDLAANSLSGIFFNVINEQVKRIINGIFKSDKWNFSFNSSIYNRNLLNTGGGLNIGSNVNASINRSFINNRVIFTASGSVQGIVQSGSIRQERTFLPDITVEVLINESGSFRAVLFYRENTDYLTTTSSTKTQKKTGVGLSYRRDVDHIGDLFKDIFRKKKKKETPVPPVTETTPVNKTEETPIKED